MKHGLTLASAALASLLLTSPALAQEPVRGGEFVVAMAVTLSELDPHATTGLPTRYVGAHLYEGVLTRGETGEIIPQLGCPPSAIRSRLSRVVGPKSRSALSPNAMVSSSAISETGMLFCAGRSPTEKPR